MGHLRSDRVLGPPVVVVVKRFSWQDEAPRFASQRQGHGGTDSVVTHRPSLAGAQGLHSAASLQYLRNLSFEAYGECVFLASVTRLTKKSSFCADAVMIDLSEPCLLGRTGVQFRGANLLLLYLCAGHRQR